MENQASDADEDFARGHPRMLDQPAFKSWGQPVSGELFFRGRGRPAPVALCYARERRLFDRQANRASRRRRVWATYVRPWAGEATAGTAERRLATMGVWGERGRPLCQLCLTKSGL